MRESRSNGKITKGDFSVDTQFLFIKKVQSPLYSYAVFLDPRLKIMTSKH